MKTRSGRVRGALLVALFVGLATVPEAVAKGGRGGHGGGGHGGGGHGGHPPRMPAAHRSANVPMQRPPKMPKAAAPTHSNVARGGMQGSNAHAGNNHASAAVTHHATTGNVNPGSKAAVNHASAAVANRGTAAVANRAAGGVARSATPTGAIAHGTATGAGSLASTAAVNPARNSSTNPYAYTYGSGSGARSYRAYGYGRNYRNRYNGGRYGYGRSQGNNRAVISRLRSVHASLARLDHDYQGHRVRAMHSISMAIRQLSHRSMTYQNGGFGSGMIGNRNMGMRQTGRGAGGRQGQRMSQAQSDARMGQALRTLQGVNMQLSSQGTGTSGHARASGHVQWAIRELNTALTIR